MRNDNESSDDINDFIQRNRKAIFMVLGIIIVLVIGAVVTFSINDFFRKKAIAEVEELTARYDELRGGINEESSDTEVEALLADLGAFAKSKSGFSGGTAWAAIARIHGDKKEWAQAGEAWLNAALAASKTYLGPVAYFNAAVAAEEQGKKEEAVELYTKCVALPVQFPQAPHAQFSIGRLNEELEKYSEAIEAYREVMIKWPDIASWSNLARSRIIELEISEVK
jgi:tetratricopeptide (TPR) repeat protein